MEEDVNRAIKQLESIAIKAMKSGYLDDAAKVMHIAEEIERVDKSGVVSDDVADESEACSDVSMLEVNTVPQSNSDEVAADETCDKPFLTLQDDSANEENVVQLNRFRMKRSAAVGDDTPDSPQS